MKQRPISLLDLLSYIVKILVYIEHIHLFSMICASPALSSLTSNLVSCRAAPLCLHSSTPPTKSIQFLLLILLSVVSFLTDVRHLSLSVINICLICLLASLPPHLLNWIHTYFLSCSQTVFLNGSISSSLHVSSGAPQGSIFGPFFFLIYINGATDLPLFLCISPSKLRCFIFRPVNSPSDMSNLHFDLNNISLLAHISLT